MGKEYRPPIVTVLGHVDHGKTTLLDAIRKTKVASGEAGGITQSIGASTVSLSDGKKITFIDTPGHAAFSKMRSRGANVADIAVLVVSADDGMKPQTKEAISYIKDAKIPFVVAITKTDLPSANPESVKSQLEKEEIFLEGRGGDVPVVLVSAKKGEGIKELLEVIGLVAEVNEINKDLSSLEAVVIETGKDKRGVLVSVVVRKGIIKVGDSITTDGISTRVRGLFGADGKPVKSVEPGEPALILGYSQLAQVGSVIRKANAEDSKVSEYAKKEVIGEVKKDQLPVVLKARNQGELEALLASLPEKVAVILAGMGDVTENDIFIAKAANASIFSFNAKVTSNVRKLSQTESVKIESFQIIYELLERLEGLVDDKQEKVIGKAEIVRMFPFKGTKNIAGSKMLEGVINKNDVLTINRDGKKLGEVKILSLRHAKNEVGVVKKGEDFGVYFEPQFDFKPHDMLLSVRVEKVEKK